ncbi:MAG: ABC transporter permease [Carbonactinosporaceae bacterium]
MTESVDMGQPGTAAPGGGAAVTPDGPVPPEPSSGRTRTLWGDVWRELLRSPLFIVSSLLVLAVVSMAVAPSLWTDVDPNNCRLSAHSKEGPSPGHPFGFTLLGCDLFAQTVYGARPSVTIAVLVTLGTTLLGVVLGIIGGYYGGFLDTLVSRATDIVFGLPLILGAVLFLSMLDSHSTWAVTAILIALGWTQTTRIMRGSVLSTKHMDYVRAARALGAPDRHIIVRHIVPNAMAPAIVISTIALGSYVSIESTLTYLGVGLQQPEISWGILISQGDAWAISGYPHLLIFPCLFLIVTVLSFILLGDALRDALDPKLR